MSKLKNFMKPIKLKRYNCNQMQSAQLISHKKSQYFFQLPASGCQKEKFWRNFNDVTQKIIKSSVNN